MEEQKRKQRNAEKVLELWPSIRIKIENIIVTMEARGFRPRIQDAHRSAVDQLKAFNEGHSHVKVSFHNIESHHGKAEALAVDLLDDDFPLNPRKNYLLNLAQVAQENSMHTGIRWGLPGALVIRIDQAIASKSFDLPLKLGWDPTHIEPLGITIEEAVQGKRPN